MEKHMFLKGHKDPITFIAYNQSNENEIASAGADNHIIIWDLTKGKIKKTLKGHEDQVNCLCFNPKDGNELASVGMDNKLLLWNVEKGEIKQKIETTKTLCLAYNPFDSNELACSGLEKIEFWDLKNSKLSFSLTHPSSSCEFIFKFNPHKKNEIASGSDDGDLFIWNTETKNHRKIKTKIDDALISAIDYSPFVQDELAAIITTGKKKIFL